MTTDDTHARRSAAIAPDDRAAILDALDRLRSAWDAGDADAYAAGFTDDASYVIYAGLFDLGREAIRRTHVSVLGKWQRGSRMSMRVIELRFVAPGVAVALTEGHVGKGRFTRYDKVQTFVMVRTDDGWRCAAFQNTKRNRLFAAVNRLADPDRAATAPR